MQASPRARPGTAGEAQEPTPADEHGRPAAHAGSRMARTGAQAIYATQRSICGDGAVGTAAAAEGLALLGSRAARVLSSNDATVATVAAASAAWVLHRTTTERGLLKEFGSFELVPGSGQEAVDHCLVAHALCDLVGAAGECVVDPDFADRLVLYEPPNADIVEPRAEAKKADPGENDLARLAQQAFARVATGTGRPVAALVPHHTEDADVVIVAAGVARDRAADIADELRRDGVPCGVVGVAQLRPCPARELAVLLRGKRVLVLASGHDRLAAAVELARPMASDGRPSDLAVIDAGSDLGKVRQVLKLDGSPSGTTTSAIAPSIAIGAMPGGPRAEELLRDVVADVASITELDLWRLGTLAPAVSGVAFGARRPSGPTDEQVDLLLVAHPTLLDPSLSKTVRRGGRVIVATHAASPEALWSQLSPGQRKSVTAHDVELCWFAAAAGSELAANDPDAPWVALRRAITEGVRNVLVNRLSLEASQVEALSGADRQLRVVEPTTGTVTPIRDPDFRPKRDLPRMPAAPAAAAGTGWRGALRRFHMTGRGAAGAAALLPLAPAAVSSLIQRVGPAPGYPLVLTDAAEGSVKSFETLLGDALAKLADAGGSVSILNEHLPRLVATSAAVLHDHGESQLLSSAMEETFARFAAELEVSEAGRKVLGDEIRALSAALPSEGRVFGLEAGTHVELYGAAVLPARRRRREAFCREVRSLTERLTNLIRVDENSPATSLGEVDQFVDTTILSQTLPARRGPTKLGATRIARIERVLATLNHYLEESSTHPDLIRVGSGSASAELAPWRVQHVVHPESLAIAGGVFDGVARRVGEVLRAARIARLEVEHAYDASVYDDMLARLEWRMFDEEELLLVPPVLVVETVERARTSATGTLTDLLRSRRPVHVMLEESLPVQAPGLGYSLVAHHEAVVIQSTLARPEHLCAALAEMGATARPAVAVVAPRPSSGPVPGWLRLAAFHEGRGLPCFRYVPDAGAAWAESFDVEENPEAEHAWPRHRIEYLTPEGETEALDEGFTFALAAALDVTYRSHFWVIPVEAWSDEQVPLTEYLQAPRSAPPGKVPYIRIVDDRGFLGRAVVSRALALECYERNRIWKSLQELGGADNEYARRAASAAREEARADLEKQRQELAAAHAEEVERVRGQAATEAMDRLARVLLDVDALAAAAPAPAPVASAAPAEHTPDPAPAEPIAAPPPPEPEPEEEEAVSFDDPYIDLPLCTTCNECTNINPQMFKYNADKQAYIADAKAGTFLQLVTAAEKCPAKCIHPGVPRDDDDTATDDLRARAAPFN